MDLIYCEYKDIQNGIKSKIETKLQDNRRFSVTADEYTSIRGRMYIKVNIHYQNCCINPELMRMPNACGAKKISELLEKQLADFEINAMLTSIVSVASDGALVRRGLGKISKVYY